ncbi:inactive serine/threonine-protein kinase PLK5 [Ctenodactylus gundi]
MNQRAARCIGPRWARRALGSSGPCTAGPQPGAHPGPPPAPLPLPGASVPGASGLRPFPPLANKTRPGAVRAQSGRSLGPAAAPGPAQMEPAARRREHREPAARRRRRGSRQVVAAFLRDPGSGRVYRRGKLIGKGAFSRCYKLIDLSTSAIFALKVVPRRGSSWAGRLSPRGKVEREIALHSRLRHRNIVAFHGHFTDRDHVYMVLEYCSRQSLAHVLKVRQTLTEPEVRYYLRGIVSGLRYLHQRSIVHRDLKLSNFFLNYNMEVKIGDLGLAARVGPGGACHRVLCGTPSFLAPEVVSRKGHTCQSDVWALGCIMYTVLTGTPPFTAALLSEMYQNIRSGHYPEPTHLSPNARHLIARLLAPNPAERPSLDLLLQDNFFTQGFTPKRLPPHSCHCPPIFAVPWPLGRLLRMLCPFTPKEDTGPEAEGPEEDVMEWGSEASLPETGAPCPEAPVQPLTQGTLRSDPTGPQGNPRLEVEAAIRKLQLCLDSRPVATQEPPGEQRPVLWALKWVDYWSKYGFGYQLSDGGSGILFRDGTHMALRPPGGRVCYRPHLGKLETFALRDTPRALGPKLAVLRLVAGSMQRRLREERAPPAAPPPPAAPGLCLLRFLAAPQVLLLLFSDGTLQISGGGDGAQVELVLTQESSSVLLPLGDSGRPSGSLCHPSFAPAARQCLRLALLALQSL